MEKTLYPPVFFGVFFEILKNREKIVFRDVNFPILGVGGSRGPEISRNFASVKNQEKTLSPPNGFSEIFGVQKMTKNIVFFNVNFAEKSVEIWKKRQKSRVLNHFFPIFPIFAKKIPENSGSGFPAPAKIENLSF